MNPSRRADIAGRADVEDIAYDRNVDRTLNLAEAVVSGFAVNIAAVRVCGLVGLEENSAAGRALPEQGALRSFKHLNALHVELIAGTAGAERYFREIGLHAGISATERLRLTADAEHVGVAGTQVRRNGERRRETLQIDRRFRVVDAQVVAGKHGHCQRDFLDIFRFSAGGDGHDLDGTIRRKGRRCRWRLIASYPLQWQERRTCRPSRTARVSYFAWTLISPSRPATLRPDVRLRALEAIANYTPIWLLL